MNSLFKITSMQNQKLKRALALKDRKGRDETGHFLIEGYRELKRAVQGQVSIEVLLACEELFLGSNEQELIDQIKRLGAEVYLCEKRVFEKLSYRDRPDGLIGVARQMQRTLRDLNPLISHISHPFLLIAESIEKPGNLGSLLRSSDAAGVNGVIVCDRCTDIYNPNVVRASVGTLFTLPVVEAKGKETLAWLSEKKIKVISATPSAKLDYMDADFSGPIAICVGTEQLGLSQHWLCASDLQVRIPMLGVADSLNVSTAATLLLYEVVRKRRGDAFGHHLL